MNRLTLNDILVFLRFLLRTRRVEVDAIDAARGLVPALDATLADIERLPSESFGGMPNAEQLARTDERHDGHGLALYYLALAYQASPSVSAESKQAAQRILDAYVPGRNHLRASYATEAARAETRRPQLSLDQAALERIPVEGGTALSWATGYVEAGAELGVFLSGRADAVGVRADALPLRGEAISEVRVFREAIAKALRRTPDAGRAVDQRLFNYLDLLAGIRERGSSEPTPPPAPDGPPPA